MCRRSTFIPARSPPAAFLREQAPGCSVFAIGEAGLLNALYDAGITMNDVNPDYVVVGEGRSYSLDTLTKATNLVMQGAKLIGANSDVSGPIENGIAPACRALIAPIEMATGKQAYFCGKPNPLMMRTGLKMLNCHSGEAVMVGDRMDTDVISGMESGMSTVLVLSGVSTRETLTHLRLPSEHRARRRGRHRSHGPRGEKMKARVPQMVIKPDYRQFRLRKLNTPEFSHIKLLLFWPVFGLAFLALERFRPHAAYHVMHCALDDAIPFSEWALIPYLLWFVYLIGALAYTFFQDVPAFRRMMRFVIVTYTAATVVYFIYPTQQLLRPEAFARDNALTRAVAWFYTFDTNTNVCPSLHVIGSAAALFALRDGPQLRKRAWWQAASVLLALCISLSTVFMKQHSILDVLCALPVCALGWWLCYGRPGRHG